MWHKSFCDELKKLAEDAKQSLTKGLLDSTKNVGKPTDTQVIRGLSELRLKSTGSKVKKLKKLEI